MGEIKISGFQRSFALAMSFFIASTVVSPKQESGWKLLAPAVAAESKWSIENVLKAKDIEIDAQNQVVSDICSAAVDREFAEMELNRGNYPDAVKTSLAVIKDLRKYLKPDDVRVQSARLLLSEAYLRSKNRNGCLKQLRSVLLQQLAADELRESKIRSGMSSSELKEDGVETSTQFEERYQRLSRDAVLRPASEALRRAELLFWENRLADALRLTRIGLSFDTGTISGDRAKFLQALIYFGLGDRAALERARRRLGEGLSVATASYATGQAGDLEKRTYIKEPRSSKVAESRETFVDGLIAELDGNHSAALKFYESAIEAMRDAEPGLDALVFRIYKGNALLNNGEPVAAYRDLNHVFETARRLVEGREKGLLFGKISQIALMEMYRTLLVRMTYESTLSKSHNTDMHDAKALSNCLERNMLNGSARIAVRPFEENYQEFADALYHVGYQFKTSHRQALAQRCFWGNVSVIETHVPEYKRQLGGTLYDLAESYFWSEQYDIAIEVFLRCIEVRREIDPDSLDYILTLNTLGRVYLAKGDELEAIACINSALHRLLHHEDRQSTRISRMVADLRRSFKPGEQDERPAPDSVASGDRYIEQISALPLPEQLDSIRKSRSGANPDTYSQIDDLWQVLADSYSRHKNYDEAVEVSKRLLELRQSAKVKSQSEILGSLWQLAYICGVSNRHKDADKYYTELLEKFGDNNSRWRALWLYSRGVVLDSLGLPERAASDFRKSIIEYKKYLKTLDKVNDKESVDQTGWMIADLEQELKAKRLCRPDASNYLKGYATCYWDKRRFPLKVYIDDSEERGFGPKLFALVKKAVDDWAETPGLEGKIKFVDDREDADIYLERVSNYDAIPYGSGGGASASFVWRGKKLTKEIDRVHLRMYCAEHDLDKMSKHAVLQLYTLALHEFGHGLGLGHSPSGLDVMYWKSAIDRLSSRDRASVRGIYGFQEERRGR